jgi:hypothetical protein
MRRVVLVVAVCLAFQLILPLPAHAWFGWWDELSGAGPFRGLEIEARVACFGQATSHPATDGTLGRIAGEFEYEAARFKLPVPDFARRLTAFNTSLRAAASNSVTVNQLNDLIEELSALRKADGFPSDDSRAVAAFTNLDRGLRDSRMKLERLKHQRASAGVVFSACPIGRDNNRRISINATARLLHSYGERKAQYAGGNEIQLAMFVPALSWRPLADFETIDVVDLSTGAGVYWFSSEGGRPGAFEPFNGFVIEPVRIDFHAPSSLTKKGVGGALLAGLSARVGLAIFPRGFEANAFGTTSTPEQAQQIPAEWVGFKAIFWDFGPLIHYATTR